MGCEQVREDAARSREHGIVVGLTLAALRKW